MRRGSGQEGVAMVLALVFLSLFGVFSGVLLGFTETGVRTTQAVRAQTQKIYAMEGAVDTAINEMRGDLLAGRDPEMSRLATCPRYEARGGTETAEAECRAESGSGGGQSGGAVPDHGILSLSNDPREHGIEQVSDVSVQVNGSIFSNTDIVNSGRASIMTVRGTVEALGDCVSTHPTAQVISTQGSLRCANTGGGADPEHGVDPGYEPAVNAPPPWRPTPTCDGNEVISLSPGTYDDAEALTKITSGTCKNIVLHLMPAADGVGVFYFDFRNDGSHEWVVSDATVSIVGGTDTGWKDTGILNRPVVPFPGGCKQQGDPAPNHGVQVIFGGDSRMTVTEGDVELCPEPSADGQQISMFGLARGEAETLITTAAPQDHADAFNVTDADAAYAIEEDEAERRFAEYRSTVGSPLSIASFTGELPIPDGSTITKVRVRVAQDGSGVPVPAQASTIATIAISGISKAATVDIAESRRYEDAYLDDPANTEALRNLQGAVGGSPMFTAAVSMTTVLMNATWLLDGLELEIAYEEPAFRAASGCIVAVYDTEAGTGCAVLKAEGIARVALQGSLYTPASPIDVNLVNVSTQIFNRGIIARVVRIGVAPLAGFAGTVAGIVRKDRTVHFTVVSGNITLAVRATFDDGGGITPGEDVTIERWTVRR